MTGMRRPILLLGCLVACLFAPISPACAADNVPGAFDYYVLVLSWMPSYCKSEGAERDDGQCEAGRRRGFLLHGLWPQYDKGWPENCPTQGRPWVPDDVIAEMRDIMPSKSLMIHEYRVHGTCSGLDPVQYFGVARELYERVNIPAVFAAKHTGLDTPEAVRNAILEVNPWLKPEMIAVACRRQNLLDVRICFGRDLFPRACGANETRKRLCPADKIGVPPVAP